MRKYGSSHKDSTFWNFISLLNLSTPKMLQFKQIEYKPDRSMIQTQAKLNYTTHTQVGQNEKRNECNKRDLQVTSTNI